MKLQDLFEASTELRVVDVADTIPYSKKNKEVFKGYEKTWNGDFSCPSRKLTSLEGCPEHIFGAFVCRNNKLKTLEGGPKEVSGGYYAEGNSLTSLKGSPREIHGTFSIEHANLTDLTNGPEIVEGSYNCVSSRLKSLVGAPREIGGNFDCYFNHLTSLNGTPEIIHDGYYNCFANRITSFQNVHKMIKEIAGKFDASDNPLKSHVLGFLFIKNLQSVCFYTEGADKKLLRVERILNRYLKRVNRTNALVLKCQQDLIEAGLEDFAQL